MPVTVNVIDDGCAISADHQELMARAIAEATTNALQHSQANRVVVFVETEDDGHIAASVVDDGIGFDPDTPRSTHGIDESIMARVVSIGGRVEINSDHERRSGTEVLLWSGSS